MFEPESFDFIVSRAVMEHLYDADAAFSVMDRLLVHGGSMIHKIDFRDHGMFSNYGFHPLTFLTIRDSIYRLMTYGSGQPNRKLLDYYLQKMNVLQYCQKILITHIVGNENEILPHKDTALHGIDYSDATLSLLNEIRPYLINGFKDMADEELMVAGIFLIAKKP
jgi:SAM-dependent methyltransferase